MADFKETRDQFSKARAAKSADVNALFLAQERLARATGDDRQTAERIVRERQESLKRTDTLAGSAFEAFAQFSDPIQQIAQLDDSFPILLFPVRLETRFKRSLNAAGAQVAQLWVRVYPDDCLVDSFEETLSVTETASARLYWENIWKSGGDKGKELAAWRGLVASHGSGRAFWIVKNYRPLNEGEMPPPGGPTDVVLTISTDAPLDAAQTTNASTFWESVWIAGDDLAAQQAARAKLDIDAGPAMAQIITDQYRPSNLQTPPPEGRARTAVKVSVAFLIFPVQDDLETRNLSWSRAPKTDLLPDRFVLLAHSGGNAKPPVIGRPIPSPLVVGPDPSAPKERQFRIDGDDVIVPDDMLWMTDFETAVANGMGFKIDLSSDEALRGFDRLIVLGVRLSQDETQGALELETLLTHHLHSSSGFSLVPQGTPTNNTESGGSGWSRFDDPEVSFADFFGPVAPPVSPDDWHRKRDGQWLAEWLGIDPAAIERAGYSQGMDQSEARAMNRALWPGTLGYWMDAMMNTVFDDAAIERTREYFTRNVLGRGAVPAIRIGRQPYGILPATAFSRMRWLDRIGRQDRFLADLYRILRLVDADWTAFSGNVAFTGKNGTDAHALLLDILGLHPASVESYRRHAESFQALFNRFNFGGPFGPIYASILAGTILGNSRALLAKLGFTGEPEPDMLGKFFYGAQDPLSGPPIDDRPLSETDEIRAYTTDGRNYLRWLREAANTSIDAVRAQKDFVNNQPPAALLYLLLRYSVEQAYFNTSLRLHADAGLLTDSAIRQVRREAPFLHVVDQAATSESRYQFLYKAEPAITKSATLTLGEYIGSTVIGLFSGRALREVAEAIELLEKTPTARLERTFFEHIDCCSYRFDSWMLGLVHHQLALMRGLSGDAPRRGIHLGAYAWLENVRPENKVQTPVRLEKQLADIFQRPGDTPLTRDSSNGGFVHAPSLNHAVTAAVLRNGYLSNADPETRQVLGVNLSSSRVRAAMSFIEGLRNGQSLGALLGYQFERGLHDRHAMAEVDKFILTIRKVFPLSADRLRRTKTGPEVSIDAIEARNVMDGLSLVEHIAKTGQRAYPFDKPLPRGTQAEEKAINAEVDRMLDVHDALADLAISEGVHQAVQGNYDRVGSTMDAFSKGLLPPEPEVVRTPVNGVTLTHRVGLHLTPIAANAGMTARQAAQPALDSWLALRMPAPSQIGCMVEYRPGGAGPRISASLTLDSLSLAPIDLVRIVQPENQQAMAELDDRILREAMSFAPPPRPDEPIVIRYMEKGPAVFSIFEMTPLIRNLRSLVTAAKPLRASDMTLQGKASDDLDVSAAIDKARVQIGRDRLATVVRAAFVAFKGALDPLIADPPTQLAAIVAGLDTHSDQLAGHLEGAARFAVPQTGWGFLYERRGGLFRSLVALAAGIAERWNARLTQHDDLISQLPAAPTDEERFDILLKAERLVSTITTHPLPTVPVLEGAVLAKRTAFAARRDALAQTADTNRTRVSDLHADLAPLFQIAAFDAEAVSLEEFDKRAIAFTLDMHSSATAVIAEIDKRVAAVDVQLAAHDAAPLGVKRVAALQAAAKALLGDDIVVIPEFALAPAEGAQLASAAGATAALLNHLTTTAGIDFPVDEWLYGVARVREKMRNWEQIVLFSGSFAVNEPPLTPTQLPFQAGDSWLAMPFPDTAALRAEHLLYTASFTAAFNPAAVQTGLLLDEWTEVVPHKEATTGITFHYDRPNTEPPQTILLVTPSAFTGAWQWNDVVDALHETLDLARKRAVEPSHLDSSAYAHFLPATVSAVTVHPITIMLNLAVNNFKAIDP